MKVKPLLSSYSPSTFLQDYITACGVTDVNKFINPDDSCYDDVWNYPNMMEAVERLNKSIRGNEKIGILVDSDCDGNLSSAIIYQYLTQTLNHHNIQLYFHKAKAHGLRKNFDEDFVPQIIQDNINLMIIPDAGTANIEESKELKQHGIDCIVLDHHNESCEGTAAIVINHNLGQGLNTALSGTGVTEKFTQAYSQHFNIKQPNYKDLVAISLVSDVCDLTTLENRAYLHEGIKSIEQKTGNPFVAELCKKFVDKRKGYNPVGFSWGCIPPINSLCRSDNQQAKFDFFMALVGEGDTKLGLKVAKEAHDIQREAINDIVKRVEPTVDYNHKVIVGFAEIKDKAYIGLAANKYCGAYGKPTLLLRQKNSTMWSGSVRSPIPIKEAINKTKLAKCQGHDEACGVELPKANLKRLINWFDSLDMLDMAPDIPVTTCLKPSQVNLSLCRLCDNNKEMWGASQGNAIVMPTFYIKTKATKNDVLICGKNKDCIRVSLNDASYWMYGASPETIEQFSQKEFMLEMIVKLSVNEWNENWYPKGKIDRWEINPVGKKFGENKDEDWKDLF